MKYLFQIDYMMKIGPKYIGQINYKMIKNFILDEDLTADDLVKLNPQNFDDLILEYREFYKYSFLAPIQILGVDINEDPMTPKDRVCAEKLRGKTSH